MTALDDIVDMQPDQIAATQLAIDGEVEQREFPDSMIQLQSDEPAPKQGRLRACLRAVQGGHRADASWRPALLGRVLRARDCAIRTAHSRALVTSLSRGS